MSQQAEKIFQDYLRSRVDWWHRALKKGVPHTIRPDVMEGLGRMKKLI